MKKGKKAEKGIKRKRRKTQRLWPNLHGSVGANVWEKKVPALQIKSSIFQTARRLYLATLIIANMFDISELHSGQLRWLRSGKDLWQPARPISNGRRRAAEKTTRWCSLKVCQAAEWDEDRAGKGNNNNSQGLIGTRLPRHITVQEGRGDGESLGEVKVRVRERDTVRVCRAESCSLWQSSVCESLLQCE